MAKEISILVIENDPGSQRAIQMMMDGEGWRMKVVDEPTSAMQELAQGTWSLVVASSAVVDAASPLFQILKELAQSAPVEDGKSRVRVLFVVPAAQAQQAIPALNAERIPYCVQPLAFNDFLEKVNDLLLQAQFLTKTARERGFAFEQRSKPRAGKAKKAGAATNSMFASRDEYYYTEEELAEYEKEQKEDEKKKKLTKRPI